MIHLNRTCAVYPENEAFEIYEGSNIHYFGQLVYSQSNCTVESTYLCFKPMEYTIIMKNFRGGLWSYNSNLILSNYKYSYTFRLLVNSGSVEIFNATTLEIINEPSPQCSEGQIPIHVNRNCDQYDGYYYSFEMYEGASIYPHGTPVYSQDLCLHTRAYICLNPVLHTIVMRDKNGHGWDRSYLILTYGDYSLWLGNAFDSGSVVIFNATTLEVVTLDPPQCSEGQMMIHFVRKCPSTHGDKESFALYKGRVNQSQSSPIYGQDLCYSVDTYFCMDPVDYTFSVMGTRGSGWNDYSYIRVSYEDSFATYRLTWGYNETHVFNPMILSKDLQCGEGEFLVNYDRTCGAQEFGETFKLIEGLDIDSQNSIVLDEGNCLLSHRYICLKPGVHTVRMTTVRTTWGKNMGAKFTYTNSSVLFSLGYGDSSTRVFNMAQLRVSQCSEEQLPVHLVRTCGYSSGGQESFDIFEGSVLVPQSEPIYSQDSCISVNTYLCLNGVNYTLIMTDHYFNGWYYDSLLDLDYDNKTLSVQLAKGSGSLQVFNPKSLEIVTPIPSQCAEGQIPIHIQRNCASSNSDLESFEIHEGLEIHPQDEAVYYQDNCISVDAFICLYPTEYTIIMRDSGGNGWNTGSTVNISNDHSSLVFQVSKGFSSLQTFNISSMELFSTNISGDCQQWYDLDNRTSIIYVAKNTCNDNDLTSLSTSQFSNLRTLWIDEDNFMYVQQFNISDNVLLTNVIIASDSFTQRKFSYGYDASRSFRIINCDSLRRLEIGPYSFSDYSNFELKNLPSLDTIMIGKIHDVSLIIGRSYNFYFSSLCIRGMKLITYFELLDLPKLQSIMIGDHAFEDSLETVLESIKKNIRFDRSRSSIIASHKTW